MFRFVAVLLVYGHEHGTPFSKSFL